MRSKLLVTIILEVLSLIELFPGALCEISRYPSDGNSKLLRKLQIKGTESTLGRQVDSTGVDDVYEDYEKEYINNENDDDDEPVSEGGIDNDYEQTKDGKSRNIENNDDQSWNSTEYEDDSSSGSISKEEEEEVKPETETETDTDSETEGDVNENTPEISIEETTDDSMRTETGGSSNDNSQNQDEDRDINEKFNETNENENLDQENENPVNSTISTSIGNIGDALIEKIIESSAIGLSGVSDEEATRNPSDSLASVTNDDVSESSEDDSEDLTEKAIESLAEKVGEILIEEASENPIKLEIGTSNNDETEQKRVENTIEISADGSVKSIGDGKAEESTDTIAEKEKEENNGKVNDAESNVSAERTDESLTDEETARDVSSETLENLVETATKSFSEEAATGVPGEETTGNPVTNPSEETIKIGDPSKEANKDPEREKIEKEEKNYEKTIRKSKIKTVEIINDETVGSPIEETADSLHREIPGETTTGYPETTTVIDSIESKMEPVQIITQRPSSATVAPSSTLAAKKKNVIIDNEELDIEEPTKHSTPAPSPALQKVKNKLYAAVPKWSGDRKIYNDMTSGSLSDRITGLLKDKITGLLQKERSQNRSAVLKHEKSGVRSSVIMRPTDKSYYTEISPENLKGALEKATKKDIIEENKLPTDRKALEEVMEPEPEGKHIYEGRVMVLRDKDWRGKIDPTADRKQEEEPGNTINDAKEAHRVKSEPEKEKDEEGVEGQLAINLNQEEEGRVEEIRPEMNKALRPEKIEEIRPEKKEEKRLHGLGRLGLKHLEDFLTKDPQEKTLEKHTDRANSKNKNQKVGKSTAKKTPRTKATLPARTTEASTEIDAEKEEEDEGTIIGLPSPPILELNDIDEPETEASPQSSKLPFIPTGAEDEDEVEERPAQTTTETTEDTPTTQMTESTSVLTTDKSAPRTVDQKSTKSQGNRNSAGRRLPNFRVAPNSRGSHVVKASQRILGARYVDLSYHPYVALLAARIDARLVHLCTAAIISEEWVITCAHCFYVDEDLLVISRIMVVTGQTGSDINNLAPDAEVSVAKEIQIHPMYREKTFDSITHDIGLVRVRKPFTFNENCMKISIRALPLPYVTDPDTDMLIPLLTQSFGWEPETSQLKIMNVTLRRSDVDTCPCVYWRYSRSLFCTFRKGSDTICKGDYGGPMVYRRQLIGIAQGIRSAKCDHAYLLEDEDCSDPVKYGMYINTCLFLEWMGRHVPGLPHQPDECYLSKSASLVPRIIPVSLSVLILIFVSVSVRFC